MHAEEVIQECQLLVIRERGAGGTNSAATVLGGCPTLRPLVSQATLPLQMFEIVPERVCVMCAWHSTLSLVKRRCRCRCLGSHSTQIRDVSQATLSLQMSRVTLDTSKGTAYCIYGLPFVSAPLRTPGGRLRRCARPSGEIPAPRGP